MSDHETPSTSDSDPVAELRELMEREVAESNAEITPGSFWLISRSDAT